MARFEEVERTFLKKIATDSERIPSLYYSENPLIRNFFWARLRVLYRLVCRYSQGRESCLDFGGGGGVFLPSLAKVFPRVVCVDLETGEAEQLIRHLSLGNVELLQGDIRTAEVEGAPFDAIVAADVLEHFQELGPAIDALRKWLKDDGYLFVSLPTEGLWYRMLRKVFGVQKPEDHYHSAVEVEDVLTQEGFRLHELRFLPLGVNVLSLFRVSVWVKRV